MDIQIILSQPYLMILLGIVALIISLSILYRHFTDVTFSGNRPRISSLYCRLFGSSDFTKPVIFIPGTKGSELADANGKVWLSLSQILPWNKPFLFDPNEPPLQPTGIFTRFVFLPLLLEYRSYYGMSTMLARNPNAFVFPYDWRRNPMDHIDDLTKLVAKVTEETGQKPSIIAHSMGGLVTHAYLKNHGEEVDKVVYVGVPFQPGLSFLDDIDQGSNVGLNKETLSAAAIFSHPGSFTLLPHSGQKLYKNEDLMEPQTWKENKLSVYRDGVGNEEVLSRNLSQAKDLFTQLDTSKTFQNRFLFIIGNCQSTLQSIDENGTRISTNGDGRVLESGAYPVEKENLSSQTFTTCAVHDQQLNDPKVLEKIVEFLK